MGFTPGSQDLGKGSMQLWEQVQGLELQVWGREDVLWEGSLDFSTCGEGQGEAL